MDFTLYWFMFPVAILVCTTAMMSGIAGTALYMPIFLLLFPALGAEYPLKTPMEAVASSLLISSFGFASGFIAYHRRRLIDYEIAGKFLTGLLSVGIGETTMPQLIRIGKISSQKMQKVIALLFIGIGVAMLITVV